MRVFSYFSVVHRQRELHLLIPLRLGNLLRERKPSQLFESLEIADRAKEDLTICLFDFRLLGNSRDLRVQTHASEPAATHSLRQARRDIRNLGRTPHRLLRGALCRPRSESKSNPLRIMRPP
jgi:hypothetical protein